MSKANQRYEIYVNEKQLILLNESDIIGLKPDNQTLVMPYKGQQKSLFQYLDLLEQSNRVGAVVLYANEAKNILIDLKSLVLTIDAAGGVIENNKNELLLIYRKQIWDLPKGKLDKNETFEAAAIRECKEEVGLDNLELKIKIANTYHFFRDRNNTRCLKRTKWYHIIHNGKDIAKPQTEEEIEIAEWVEQSKLFDKKPMYSNISVVLNKFVEWRKTSKTETA